MENMFDYGLKSQIHTLPPLFWIPLVLLILWSLFWKGLALWHSAQRKEKSWFILLLILNTAGILEIIYLFAVVKLKLSELFSTRVF